MLFLFRSAPVEKRIHSKLFRKFWRSRGTKEPAYITVEEESEKKLREIYCTSEANFQFGIFLTTYRKCII